MKANGLTEECSCGRCGLENNVTINRRLAKNLESLLVTLEASSFSLQMGVHRNTKNLLETSVLIESIYEFIKTIENVLAKLCPFNCGECKLCINFLNETIKTTFGCVDTNCAHAFCQIIEDRDEIFNRLGVCGNAHDLIFGQCWQETEPKDERELKAIVGNMAIVFQSPFING